MNTIKLRVCLDEAGHPQGCYRVRLQLNPYADQLPSIGGMFRACYEVEMLRGSRRVLPSGAVVYRFELDEQEAVNLRRGVLAAFFPTTDN